MVTTSVTQRTITGYLGKFLSQVLARSKVSSTPESADGQGSHVMYGVTGPTPPECFAVFSQRLWEFRAGRSCIIQEQAIFP